MEFDRIAALRSESYHLDRESGVGMCDQFASPTVLVRCRCTGLRNLFKKLAERGTPANSVRFLNIIGEIEELNQQRADEAFQRLDLLMGELKNAYDGLGGFILSADRYKDYIECDVVGNRAMF